jgi:hypothetical protein
MNGSTTGGIEQVAVKVLPDGRLNRVNAAAYLGVATQTLAVWASKKIGPKPVRIGSKVFYFRADLDRFISGDDAARTAPEPPMEDSTTPRRSTILRDIKQRELAALSGREPPVPEEPGGARP